MIYLPTVHKLHVKIMLSLVPKIFEVHSKILPNLPEGASVSLVPLYCFTLFFLVCFVNWSSRSIVATCLKPLIGSVFSKPN